MPGLVSLIALLLAGGATWPATTRAATPFENWAAVVVSGDDHAAHTDQPTRTFDNARRDIAAALERRGFAPANLLEFSVRPDRRLEPATRVASFAAITEGLTTLAARAPNGCLVYFTSHGAPQGVVLGDALLSPALMAAMVARACRGRPTVVVVSACFSGVFVPTLKGPERMVLTAARRDRSSFGCGEADRYPYFDGCVLESLRPARDFLVLASATRACVSRREREEGMTPPSQPQLFIGGAIRPLLAASPFPPG